jgi:hypothetical protein
MMTNDGSRAVRWLILLALSIATAGMFLISMRANYLYGRSIGQSPETQETLAWANVGADVWKAFGLIVVAVLFRKSMYRAAVATMLTWAICLSFSVTSAIGIYVQERTTLTGGREAKHASYEDATKELANVERRIKGLAKHRTVAEVEAAIAAIFARPVVVGERIRGTVGTLSADCSKHDRRTAEACVEAARLREELAVANEAAKLDRRATGLRRQVAELRGKGGSLAPDPVGEFWAFVSRGWITVQAVGFGLPLFFALMIETVSSLGPLAIVAYAEATRRHSSNDTMRSVVAGRAASRSAEVSRSDSMATVIESKMGGAVDFIADRTEPTTDPAAVSIEELYADYQAWCRENQLQPRSFESFADDFDRVREMALLEGKIRKFGTRYYGIRLIGKNVTRLPTRKRDK